MYGALNPNRNGFRPPKIVRGVIIVLGLFILVVFIVDKLVWQTPQQTADSVAVVAHLNRHDVRRVTIPASTVTIELNDGKRLTANVPAERDLWPLIRGSGADVTLVNGGPPPDERSFFSILFQFVPFIIMALLVVFILRTLRRRPG
jgi:ATP-dependent Zn protease